MNLQYFFLALFLIINSPICAQDNAWISANEGIGDLSNGDSFEVNDIVRLTNGEVYSFIRYHSRGEEADGVYRFLPDTRSWERIAPRINQHGFRVAISSGTRIYAIPGSNSRTVYELDIANGEWITRINLPDFGLQLTRGVDALGDHLYIPCRVEGNDIISDNSELNFRRNEEFIMKVNVPAGTYELLRNASAPLIIGSRGGNPKNPIALQNGKVYHYSTFDYRANDGWGGLYEWDGRNWSSASAGLNGINITGSGFGPIGPIYSDINHERLFIKTEQGFYEKTDTGWLKYFYRTGGIMAITSDFLYINNGNGRFSKVNNAITVSVNNSGLDCIDRISSFIPLGQNQYLAAMRTQVDGQGNCSDNMDDRREVGIYFFNADFPEKGRVKNLHLQTGTYLGGEGENEVAETLFLPNGNILVAGKFQSAMGAPIESRHGATQQEPNILILNSTGDEVLHAYVLGDHLSDVDINSSGQIAAIGSFGVSAFSSSMDLLWNNPENTTSSGRIAISETGNVVAKLASADNGAGIVGLYNSNGELMHYNDQLDNNGVHINDVDINQTHNQYYIGGFTQASGVLQVAYLRSYTIGNEASNQWKTWGFSASEINTNENGADTRIYRIKATDDAIIVAGESAGGGPGGFTVFAYNGKDLQTRVANNGNDFFTDGTNSCGPCHITFLGRIDPESGTVERGKFFHARLSNGKTNTHRVRRGDLAIDDEGNVLVVGEAASQIQDRDVFNVNGRLVGRYAGDQYVLMTTPNFQTRLLWGVFSENLGNGTANRIAFGHGKVAYLAQTTRGEMMTTENALRADPFNSADADGHLAASDTYFALWNSKVWETANLDEVELATISADSCFRADDDPCRLTDPFQQSLEDNIKPFNMITPNNDGINDTWRIDGLAFFDEYEIKVFNKNGQIVFESNNYRDRWDGTFEGQPLPGGVYFYSITVNGSGVRTGYVTILY